MTKPARYGEIASSSAGEASLVAPDPAEFSTTKRYLEDGMNATKVCKDCGPQPIENFGIAHGRPKPRCKDCHRVFRRRYGDGSRRTPRRPGEIEAHPFVEWLKDYVERHGGTTMAAQRLEVAERIVYRWTHTPGPFVPETTVDRFFCAAGEPYLLREMFPELYGEEMAA